MSNANLIILNKKDENHTTELKDFRFIMTFSIKYKFVEKIILKLRN